MSRKLQAYKTAQPVGAADLPTLQKIQLLQELQNKIDQLTESLHFMQYFPAVLPEDCINVKMLQKTERDLNSTFVVAGVKMKDLYLQLKIEDNATKKER